MMKILHLFFITLLIISVPTISLAGSIQPTSPPGSTMKTLDQVEPRIPIGDGTTPGDDSSLYKITSPGSYYLTGNVTINFKHAILIDSDDVTVDLSGYRLWSSYSKPMGNLDFDGIHIVAERQNIEIRNGSIASDNTSILILTFRGFRNGIYAETGTERIRVKDILVSDARDNGIFMEGSRHTVQHCTAKDNGTSSVDIVNGIYAGTDSTVTDNTVSNNGDTATGQYVYAIHVSTGSTVTGNTVCFNGSSAKSVLGIKAGPICIVSGNMTSKNGSSADGDVLGIYAGDGSTVTGNTARNTR